MRKLTQKLGYVWMLIAGVLWFQSCGTNISVNQTDESYKNKIVDCKEVIPIFNEFTNEQKKINPNFNSENQMVFMTYDELQGYLNQVKKESDAKGIAQKDIKIGIYLAKYPNEKKYSSPGNHTIFMRQIFNNPYTPTEEECETCINKNGKPVTKAK